MAEIEFDLETAQYELEQVNNLLGIFQDFYGKECPDGEKVPPAWEARIFAERTHQHICLISAAQDKLISLVKDMETAVRNYYSDAKKKGADLNRAGKRF